MITYRENRKQAFGKAGQALAELAVFGTIFLMVLAALISYGLRYSAQQEASMTAFRRALRIASDPNRGSGAAMVVKNQDVPDPLDLVGVGTSSPVFSSASVVKNPMQHQQAVDAESLDGSLMDIQTSHNVQPSGEVSNLWMRRQYTMAGFRIEYQVPEGTLDKYKLVYGGVLGKRAGTSLPVTHGDHWVSTSSDEVEKMDIPGTCHEETTYDYEGTPIVTTVCDKAYTEIRIVDSCSGELLDYATCYAQSRRLVDVEYCKYMANREKTPGDDTDWNAVCNKVTRPPNQNVRTFDPDLGGAWYAANYQLPSENTIQPGAYRFPVLEQLFSYAGGGPEVKGMGMQRDSTQTVARDRTITRDETPTQITTDEQASATSIWQTDIVYQDNMGAGGFEQTHGSAGEYDQVGAYETVTSESSVTVDQTVRTNK